MRKSFIKKQAIKLILIIFAVAVLIFTGCQKYSDSKTAAKDNTAESQNHETVNTDNQYIGKDEEKGKEKPDDANTDILDGGHTPGDMMLSKPGESHPELLLEPDVKVSLHPAPII